jgi:hypothetical protein
MAKEAGGIGRGDEVDRLPNGGLQCLTGSCLGASQKRFDLGEGLLTKTNLRQGYRATRTNRWDISS